VNFDEMADSSLLSLILWLS